MLTTSPAVATTLGTKGLGGARSAVCQPDGKLWTNVKLNGN